MDVDDSDRDESFKSGKSDKADKSDESCSIGEPIESEEIMYGESDESESDVSETWMV